MTLPALLFSFLVVGASASEVQRGRALFDADGCRSCHRIGAVGGNSGPDLTFVGFRRSAAWLDAWLKNPRKWKGDTLMPDFKLSDSSRQALVAYLASLRGRSLDLPRDGRALFAKSGCVACHGAGGKGGHPNNNVPGVSIPGLRGVSAAYTETELRAKIARGSKPQKADPSGPEPLVQMPAWGEVLTDDQIAAVAGYLLSLAPAEASSW